MRSRNAGTSVFGREQELERLTAALAGLQAGIGGSVLVAGEPGIGKSSLARCLAARAEELEVPVFWGFAWETGGAPAYWPWTQVFRSLGNQRSPPYPESMVQILPELAAERQGPLTLQPDQARFRLLEDVRALLDRMTADGPLVLVLEDLHAADSDSLLLLAHLTRHVRQMPLLLVGTFRDMEARGSKAFDPLWQAARNADLLRPGRLDEAATRCLVESLTGRAATDAEIAHLLSLTDGNPLFLEELIDLMSEGGATAGRLPASVQQVIARQVDRLPADTAAVLEAAAVVGRVFSLDALANLTGRPADDVTAALAPAVTTGLIEGVRGNRYRFFHALCCEALQQASESAERNALHARHAAYVRRQIEAGMVDRAAELAVHLSRAGPAFRSEAVRAWRAAARRATDRLAYREASQDLRHALDLIADTPDFPLIDRHQLLLETATARINEGDVDPGHALCLEAYELARSMENPKLMAEAALTYGRAIVVARVDPELVAVLDESLARLPDTDIATRARVTARLAAARQPAPRPMEAVELAREAIELARSTGDEAVVYEVLRSAVAAMMDFAPAAERIPLNEAFGALAKRFGNVPDQFRTTLRLIIDAGELGDGAMLERNVRSAARIAARIELPHYGWRAESMHALMATVRGHFGDALEHLERAKALAARAEDPGARLTIPIQQLTVLMEWAEADQASLASVSADLDEALALFPDAELYVRPIFTSYRDAGATLPVIDNDALVQRIVQGGDRFTISRLGELAIANNRPDVARLAYRTLMPYESQCATMGLMGSAWTGPIAHVLGRIADFSGEHEAARGHYERALKICGRMQAQPTAARVHQDLALCLENLGDDALARHHERLARELRQRFALKPARSLDVGAPTAPPATVEPPAGGPSAGTFKMTRDGDLWRVAYGGSQALIKASRGLELLARLCEHPHREIHVLDLTGSGGGAVDAGGDAGMPDQQARIAYRDRISELQEALEEAETLGDEGRAESAREEIEFISRELAGAFGLGGRERPSGTAAERARVNAQRRLSDAIKRIGQHLPEAGEFLKKSVRTGRYCVYKP